MEGLGQLRPSNCVPTFLPCTTKWEEEEIRVDYSNPVIYEGVNC
jgi:hypothetical protein